MCFLKCEWGVKSSDAKGFFQKVYLNRLIHIMKSVQFTQTRCTSLYLIVSVVFVLGENENKLKIASVLLCFARMQ